MATVIRFILAIFAVLLIVAGVILAPSPIPVGILLIAIGFAILVTVAPGPVRWLRRHWRWFDRVLHALEEKLPRPFAEKIRESDFEHDEEEEEEDEDRAPTPRTKAGPKRSPARRPIRRARRFWNGSRPRTAVNRRCALWRAS